MITLHIITESEFISCRKSSLALSRSATDKPNNNLINSEDDLCTKKIFLKIKNISYSAKENTIFNIFKKYSVAENSIKFLRNKKGNFEGEAVIAFLSEEEAEKALKEKNGELLFSQNLRLEFSNFDEFEEFAFSGAFNYASKFLSEIVSPHEVYDTLFVSNFPLDYPKESVMRLLEVFNLVIWFILFICYLFS